MAENINVSEESAEGYATGISGTTECFVKEELGFCDNQSTISANQNGKTAYEESQTALELFGICLEQEAKNIRQLGADFSQYDEMLADLCELGKCIPAIVVGE